MGGPHLDAKPLAYAASHWQPYSPKAQALSLVDMFRDMRSSTPLFALEKEAYAILEFDPRSLLERNMLHDATPAAPAGRRLRTDLLRR